MVWDDIRGHAAQVAQLRTSARRERLAHAYLFVGPEGVGKRTFAARFTQCLQCERFPESALDACGQCPACKQVRAHTHPDCFEVACPEGKREIPIEALLGPPEKRGRAGLCYELSHTPLGGRRKVAIIDDADLLNEEGANALLKTLEEPPPHSLLILIATNVDGLLPTIRSRCQVLRFSTLAARDVAELLVETGLTVEPAEAAAAAALSEGSLTLAAQLLDLTLRTQRELLYDGLASVPLPSGPLAARLVEQIEGAGSAAEQRQQAGWVVRFCVAFYHAALAALAEGGPARDAVPIPQVHRFLARWDDTVPEHLEAIAGLLERAMLAETQLARNAGVTLCLEALFDDLGRLTRQVALS